MSTYFYGVDANSVGTLFGSLNTRNSANSVFSSNFLNSISDYASIQNGSYGKLLKAYYKTESASETETDSKEDKASKTEAVNVRDAAADLKSSINKLTDKSSDLFAKKEITAEDGTKTTDYDKEAIYKAVKGFVDSYNDTIDAVGDSNNNSVLRKGTSMVSLTDTMSNMLDDIGISVSASNKLSIDKDAFMDADMSDVKVMFQGTGSYGYQIGSAASTIVNSSNTQIAQLSGSLYTNAGTYGSGLYSGSLYSDYF